MRHAWMFAAVLLCTSPALAADEPVLRNEKDRVNYAVGVNIVNTVKQQGVDVDPEMVIRGIRDGFSGGALLLPDEELHKALNQFLVQVRQKRAQITARTAAGNKQAGAEFLAANAKKEGIVVLPSGLQYRAIRTGTGKKPLDGDTIECRYRGQLLDGREFDSSARTGGPASMKVASLMPGWREAIRLMPTGSRWQLFVPSGLAYGERGSGMLIGPNATLVLDVELIAVK